MPKQNTTLEIEGMSCGHCVKTVRGALEELRGVEVVDVEIGSATVILDDSLTNFETVADAVDDTGFEVRRSSAE